MKGHILVIEDEEKIARLLELELGYEGYEVECTLAGRERLDKAQSGQWSVILLDIMLPEFSGLDLGANDYITKPESSMAIPIDIFSNSKMDPVVIKSVTFGMPGIMLVCMVLVILNRHRRSKLLS